MRVSDVMTRDVMVVSPHASVRDVARKMDQLNVGALPVCDGTRLVGIVTDRDITVRCTATGSPPDVTRVHEVMSDDVRWCFADDPIQEAEQEMSQLQVRRLPVIDRRKNLIGIVSLGDLASEQAPGTEETLRAISEPAEPDRSGRPTTTRGARNARGGPRMQTVRSGQRASRGNETPPLQAHGRGYGERYGTDDLTFDYGGVDPGFGYGAYGAESYGRAHMDRSADLGMPGGYRGRGPRGYRRSDERIREDLNERLLLDTELDATNIDVEVRDGEITLAGTVGSRYDKRRAEGIAESVSGRTHVQNNLRIFQQQMVGNASGKTG